LPSPLNDVRRPELDGLRGPAILLVLYHHYVGLALRVTPGSAAAYLLAPGRIAWSGVDLFFVLSGFLIGGILLDNRESPVYFNTFYLRRALRILPLFITVLGLFYLLKLPAWLIGIEIPWYGYATFTQNFWMATGGGFGAAALAATWSLAVEEQFYLALPILIRRVSPKMLLRVSLAAAAIAPLVRLAIYLTVPTAPFACYVLLPARMDALMLGVAAACMVREGRVPRMRVLYPAWAILGTVVAYLSIKSPGYHDRAMMLFGYTVLALFYLSVLLIGVSGGFRVLTTKVLTRSGLLAYGLYMLHTPIIWAFFGGEPELSSIRAGAVTLAAAASVFLLASMSWKLFEKPLLAFGHRFRYFPALGDQVGVTHPVLLGVEANPLPAVRPPIF
jgi:peptidoglycan/LPS O-acetylase OafA/YrhL